MVAPVSAVIPVQQPHPDHLAATLDGLAQQTRPPAEVIIVDSSPEKHVSIRGDLPFPVRVQWHPEWADRGNTLPMQRRTGIQMARYPFILRLDEDAIFTAPDHIEILLERLNEGGVVAACSRVEPIGGNTAGRLEAGLQAIHPSFGLFPIYPKSLCPDGHDCYPDDVTVPFSPRASDLMFASHLLRQGRVVREDSLVAQTSLPTTRTQAIFAGVGIAAINAVVVGVTQAAIRRGTD